MRWLPGIGVACSLVVMRHRAGVRRIMWCRGGPVVRRRWRIWSCCVTSITRSSSPRGSLCGTSGRCGSRAMGHLSSPHRRGSTRNRNPSVMPGTGDPARTARRARPASRAGPARPLILAHPMPPDVARRAEPAAHLSCRPNCLGGSASRTGGGASTCAGMARRDARRARARGVRPACVRARLGTSAAQRAGRQVVTRV